MGLGVGVGVGVGGLGAGVGLGVGVGTGGRGVPPVDEVDGVEAKNEEEEGIAPPPQPVTPNAASKTATNLPCVLGENRKMSLRSRGSDAKGQVRR